MRRRDWRERHPRAESSQRSRGYGRGYDAYAAGEAFRPAGFRFGPEEGPGPGGIADEEWQMTRLGREDYRGRGPKGYRRSDERIHEEVCERLTDDWSVDASDVSVSVQDGEVTLSGFVPSRDQKRRAEHCIERISGVRDVINQLRVNREVPIRDDGRSVAADRGR